MAKEPSISETEISSLKEELENFRKEKESIRKIVGQVGGAEFARKDRLLNTLFIGGIVGLFILDCANHFLHLQIPLLTPQFSIEIGVLMVSLKIIWMMHKQVKVEHFQFWILNSIEFRLNDIAKRIRQIENLVKEKSK